MPNSAIDPDILVRAVQMFNGGQQDQAVAIMKPLAEAGSGAAAAVTTWFLHQMGDRWREAIPYAKQAVDAGFLQAAGLVIGNMLNDALLRPQVRELAAKAAPFGIQYFDPIGQAINWAQQGDGPSASAMLTDPYPGPLPYWDPVSWTSLTEQASASLAAVQNEREQAALAREMVEQAAATASEVIQTSQNNVESQTQQLLKLITTATNAEAADFFETQAKESESSANLAWRVGIGVVVGAVVFAALPIVLHYWFQVFGSGHELNQNQLLTAHVSAALSFATLAGVLLTRSRVRDRTRQRNKDLSVALQTMYAYGTQILDPDERQLFIRDMGRTVIEAFLSQEIGKEDSGRDVLSLLQQSRS